MKRLAVMLALLLGSGAAFGLDRPRRSAFPDTRQIDCEPMVIYDITGYTNLERIHLHLSVYSDGLTSVASLEQDRFNVELAWLPRERVYRLVDDLVALGALEMKDSWPIWSDLPLSTVTVFKDNSGRSPYNTFSFFAADSQKLARIAAILESFIEEAFPSTRHRGDPSEVASGEGVREEPARQGQLSPGLPQTDLRLARDPRPWSEGY